MIKNYLILKIQTNVIARLFQSKLSHVTCLNIGKKFTVLQFHFPYLLLFALMSNNLNGIYAASYTATGGAWGVAASWGGAGIPGAGDNATIPTEKQLLLLIQLQV